MERVVESIKANALSSGAIAVLTGYLAYRYLLSSGRKLPPGPRALPLLGNARDFPPAGALEYEHWLKHKDLYGPISAVTVLGTTLVLIHDKKAAHDLLELTSLKTSGRPTMVFASELCGYGSIILGCEGYTARFRNCRKQLHRELGTTVSAAKFQGAQQREVSRQLVRTLNEPEKWLEHIKE